LGWIQANQLDSTSDQKVWNFNFMLGWLRTHDMKQIGLNWINEWISENEQQIYGNGFKIYDYFQGDIGATSKEHLVWDACWYILVDCIDTSWFQPVQQLREVDGIPLVWRIVWDMKADSWSKPFGDSVVKDVHIYW